LKDFATQIRDLPLQRLVLTVIERYQEPLQKLPATFNKAYAFYGGLLEHTVSVTRTCLQLAERYAAHYTELQPPLNRDLVCAAAILHDFGRIVELDAGRLPAVPTVPGRLFGHLLLARDLVRDTARDIADLSRSCFNSWNMRSSRTSTSRKAARRASR
jgi:3'-5' exoribonuclease